MKIGEHCFCLALEVRKELTLISVSLSFFVGYLIYIFVQACHINVFFFISLDALGLQQYLIQRSVIEPNRTRQSNIIELTLKFGKSNKMECSIAERSTIRNEIPRSTVVLSQMFD